MRSGRLILLFTLLLVVSTPLDAAAQWVGYKNELELQLTTEFQFSNREFRDITLVGLGTQSLRETLAVSYVPIDRLGIQISGTVQGDRYTGAMFSGRLLLPHGENDFDGWHGNVGDFNGTLQYMAYDGSLTITPTLKTKIPMTDYPRTGFAASGSGLKELGGGIEIGKVGAFTDLLVLFGGASYTFVEKERAGGNDTAQYRPSFAEVSLYGAYSIGDNFVFGAGALYHHTFEGFDLDDFGGLVVNDPMNGLVLYHDPVTKRIYLSVSAFALYNLTPKLTGGLLFSIIPIGDNVSDAKTIGLQFGWKVMGS